MCWINALPIWSLDFNFSCIQVEILSRLLLGSELKSLGSIRWGLWIVRAHLMAVCFFWGHVALDKSLTDGPNNWWWHLQARLLAEQQKHDGLAQIGTRRKGGHGGGKGTGCISASYSFCTPLDDHTQKEIPMTLFYSIVSLNSDLLCILCSDRRNWQGFSGLVNSTHTKYGENVRVLYWLC